MAMLASKDPEVKTVDEPDRCPDLAESDPNLLRGLFYALAPKTNAVSANGTKRTVAFATPKSAFDPERTSTAQLQR
jgi:hypothetical protein